MTIRIVSIGAAVQDVFLSQSDVLAPVCVDPEHCFAQLELGAKADVNQINFSTGGGATNGAVTFARQGHEAVFMGVIGKDPAGQAVLDDLGFQHRRLRTLGGCGDLHDGFRGKVGRWWRRRWRCDGCG